MSHLKNKLKIIWYYLFYSATCVYIRDAPKSLRAFGASAAGFANVLRPSGLRTSAGFAKAKTLRKARGRYSQC